METELALPCVWMGTGTDSEGELEGITFSASESRDAAPVSTLVGKYLSNTLKAYTTVPHNSYSFRRGYQMKIYSSCESKIVTCFMRESKNFKTPTKSNNLPSSDTSISTRACPTLHTSSVSKCTARTIPSYLQVIVTVALSDCTSQMLSNCATSSPTLTYLGSGSVVWDLCVCWICVV